MPVLFLLNFTKCPKKTENATEEYQHTGNMFLEIQRISKMIIKIYKNLFINYYLLYFQIYMIRMFLLNKFSLISKARAIMLYKITLWTLPQENNSGISNNLRKHQFILILKKLNERKYSWGSLGIFAEYFPVHRCLQKIVSGVFCVQFVQSRILYSSLLHYGTYIFVPVYLSRLI